MPGRWITHNAYANLIPAAGGALNVVTEYGDLPLASDHTDEIYHVRTTTGTLFVDRRRAGQYISNGSEWIYISGLQNVQEMPDPTDGPGYIYSNGTAWSLDTPSGTGDMMKANYDTNNDNKVNAADLADSVPWSGITGIPDMFTPDIHTHVMTEVIDLPSFGNAVGLNLGTGSNEIAEGNHNHELSNLIEKSYNSLTDKPTIPNQADLIAKALMLANSIIAAVNSSTPFALEMAEGTVVGRATGGNVTAMSIDTDLASTSANHDTIPSAKAVKTALDGKMTLTTIGIADDNLVAIDDASVNSGEYPQFTANGVQGITIQSLVSNIGTNLHNVYLETQPADDTMQGFFMTLKAGASLSFKDLCIQSSGKMIKADADAWSTAGGMLALCAETGGLTTDQTGKFLMWGVVRDDSVNLTLDAILYASTTAGAIGESGPTGEDDVSKMIGQQITEDVNVFFFMGSVGGIEYDAP